MSVTNTKILKLNPKSDNDITVCGDKWRITVLTERLLRLEYSESGEFEDRATRLAANRNFEKPPFEKYEENGILHIVTSYLHLTYDKKPFSKAGLKIVICGTNDWVYGTAEEELYHGFEGDNLGGSVRTLDGAGDKIKLDDGLLSKCCGFSSGYSVVDDSQTIAINENGWPEPLLGERTDIYFFGYMKAYEECIKDFYRLSGPSPILPRYSLGNWWSRYHKYSDSEYRALIEDFKQHKVPLSVAVLDMDWHITKTPDEKRYGSGWTGYTFNKELFPDYKDTMKFVHENGLKLSLNLHPKDGIRSYEECYGAMCKEIGTDAEKGDAVEFRADSEKFMKAYFKTVLNPYEDDGVDLWWIDWQQSDRTADGYDTLWLLNYCHYLDSARHGRSPLTLSRYAGIGSHRFPLGFSGDTETTWQALDFQPYFTATAANVGYSWWSHDIGGHGTGYDDDELYIRWVQFGVFSPIMRLHGCPNPFMDKRPWAKRPEIEAIAEEFMRLRHKLVPYIFTMMYKNHEDGIPMVRPLYHKYPNSFDGALIRKNEYFFGENMIVSPITRKSEPESRLSYATTWLPDGIFIDLFSNRIYRGGKTFRAYRGLEGEPVFVKAGSVIPMCGDVSKNGVDNPECLELHIFAGESGSFTMVEDNGFIDERRCVVRTKYDFDFKEYSTLKFTAPDSNQTIPERRSYRLFFRAFEKPSSVSLRINEKNIPVNFSYDSLRREIELEPFFVNDGDCVLVTVKTSGALPENETEQSSFNILSRAQIEYHTKSCVYECVCSEKTTPEKLAEIISFDGNPWWLDRGENHINEHLARAIAEILSAY